MAATQIMNVLKKHRICTMLANITVNLVTDDLETEPRFTIEEREKLCQHACITFGNQLTPTE